MRSPQISLVLCEVHWPFWWCVKWRLRFDETHRNIPKGRDGKIARLLGMLLGHMKERHAWHRSVALYREPSKMFDGFARICWCICADLLMDLLMDILPILKNKGEEILPCQRKIPMSVLLKNFVSDAHRKAWRLAELFYRLKGHWKRIAFCTCLCQT